jgi:cytochrome c553
MIMPSEEYNRFVDADLAAVVAYVRQLPAATGAKAEIRLPMPVKALYAAGVFMDASEKIDHSLPPAQPVPEGITPAHGAYVANGCVGCHGAKLAGGKIPGAARLASRGQAHAGPGGALIATRAPSTVAMLKTGKSRRRQRQHGDAISPR